MRLGINLRGDLAKLSDEALASHLEECVADRKGLAPHAGNLLTRRFYENGDSMPFGRGPFHARIFYRVMARMYGLRLNGYSLGDLYLLDCEIKDIMAEFKRRERIARRQAISR